MCIINDRYIGDEFEGNSPFDKEKVSLKTGLNILCFLLYNAHSMYTFRLD